MEINKILQDFEKGDFERVYFFAGKEEASKNEFLRSLKKKIVYPEFNWDSHYAEELDFPTLYHSLFSLPFLSQLKVMVVKNAGDITSKVLTRLNETASKIPSTNCLIFCDDEASSQIQRLITKIGKIVSFDKLTRPQLKNWIIKRLKEDNKNIDSEAIALLLENTNGNLSVIARELDKLISYTDKREKIGLKDVEKISIDTKTYTIYQLIDKISEKNTEDSLRILHNLLMSEISPQQIIGMLRWQLAKIWQAKALVSNGLSSYKALEQVKIPFFKRKFFTNHMNNFTWESLRQCFNLLLETDTQIKRGAQPDLSLELLLFRITSQVVS